MLPVAFLTAVWASRVLNMHDVCDGQHGRKCGVMLLIVLSWTGFNTGPNPIKDAQWQGQANRTLWAYLPATLHERRLGCKF